MLTLTLDNQPIELPPVQQLFADQGAAHADYLLVVEEVLAELAKEGIHPSREEFTLRYSQAWEVWKQYCPTV